MAVMVATYSIAELAREFAVTPRALRFYESKGLLEPRREGQRRIFSERDRVRLKLTLRGKRLGLTLEEITEIIDMYDPSGSSDAPQLLLLCTRIGAHRRLLLERLQDIQATLAAMDEVEKGCLETLARLAGGPAPDARGRSPL
jgi:DNA-binding transcriptional MerR regulator